MRGREYDRSFSHRQERDRRDAYGRVWRQPHQPIPDGPRRRAAEDIIRAVELHGTSLFFTDFPNGWPRAEMWRHFQNFGHVVDVFVPKKKSREGKEFGFGRYRGVRNPDNLSLHIHSVKIGTNVLTINVSRFQRNGSSNQSQAFHHGKGHHAVSGPNKLPTQLNNQLTYCEALKKTGQSSMSVPVKFPSKTIVFNQPNDEEIKWLENCALGEVKNSQTLNDGWFPGLTSM